MTTIREFNYKIGALEIRSVGRGLVKSHYPHITAEIIQWVKRDKPYKYSNGKISDEYCYVVAYWTYGEEKKRELKFCGNRPFDKKIDWDAFQKLIKIGYDTIEANIKKGDPWNIKTSSDSCQFRHRQYDGTYVCNLNHYYLCSYDICPRRVEE